jgi:DNA repair protein RecN (Recombination protein N)
MLLRLQIENFALIDRLAIEFGPGFNVVTGETGSGKSILIGALGLLLGDKADADVIRAGADRAAITGVFELAGDRRRPVLALLREAGVGAAASDSSELESEMPFEIIIRREIAAGGRSRAFIEDQPVTVATLRRLAALLGRIHSQREALIAFSPAAELELLDRFLALHDPGYRPARASVERAYAEWRAALTDLETLEGQGQKRLQEADLWRFQMQELVSSDLHAGEDTACETEHRLLANAARVLEDSQSAYSALYDGPEAVVVNLKAAERRIGDLARLDPAAEPLIARLIAVRAEVEDVAELLRAWVDRVEASPGRLQELEDRIGILDRLKRKYGRNLDELIAYRDELATLLEAADSAGERLQHARSRVTESERICHDAVVALSRLRAAAAPKLARAVERQAAELALRPTLRIQIQPAADPADWSASGGDRVQFLASLNPGEPLHPLSEVASGGELSRLLLALHVVIAGAAGDGLPLVSTLVFDEIDAGIGGRAADSVGEKLRRLAAVHQVLCVTHLAQIACFGDVHLQVEKEEKDGRTLTRVERLTGPKRVNEVARMMAGRQTNDTARRHAAELLQSRAAVR